MSEFAGKIELDIRDSTPDWAPYLAPKAPEGAPNVLFVVWDDVGYGTMDCFGGPVQTPDDDAASPTWGCATRTSTPRRCARRPAPRC